ncbi:unnamed protein product [Lactuca saligna]|uniref:Glycerol-3-phosphate dehydrogenase n=1 Tax=Lactuca saligna TaxID=75948 RepID=A0AA35ZP91_LACSI|nr:unnamed protein product [Lactuca saligna]
MTSFFRARRVGVTAASLAVAVGGSYVALRDPYVSSNDRNGSGTALDAVRRKITDPVAVVPSRTLQESSLIAANSSNPLDILVVGGGATGCGVALDAVTRGLRVGLVERDDFSSGTSSRSTKLIHGGVRYLEKAVFNLDYGQLKLVFHALEERKQVIDNAPHLCHALPCMTPCFSWFEALYYWVGLKMYDLVAGRRLLHLSRYYSAQESAELFPTLARKGKDRSLKGTVVYYDGQMNDSRVNVGLACTAALAGASVLNHAEVVSLIKEDGGDRVIGARIRDNLSGTEFETYAKVIVNAGGPFCDSVRKLADKDAKPMICPSSGVHIVLPDYYSPEGMGLIVPKTKDGRVVFMLPWLGRTVAGTTDSNTSITMLPEPHEDEIEFILDAICDYLNVKVRRTDVLSAWSGIRPLATDPNAKNTESISRDHVVCEDFPGLVTITGGKWTTYRSMAEDAVDAAIKSGNLNPKNTSLTSKIRLVGGEGWDPAFFTVLAQEYVRMKVAHNGKIVPGVMDTAAAKHLSHSYGTMAEKVAYIAQKENLGKRLAHGYPYLEAEVAYCARNEYCESAVDFIARRSRLAFLDTDAAGRALPRVIQILADEHRWDKKRQKEEFQTATQERGESDATIIQTTKAPPIEWKAGTYTPHTKHARPPSSRPAGVSTGKYSLSPCHNHESRTEELMASGVRMSNNGSSKHVTPPPSARSVGSGGAASVRSKTPSSSASRRSVTPNSRSHTRQSDDDAEPGRVRVAIRLRPKNTEDLSDADFFDCVELQPELMKLKLKKNNWSSDSYRFDEVFTESASQKRVYEAVAKPVVEGVLNGYNGTIMAYGQTGTGKTYTLGKLGKDDASERGIMVRALEDIIASASPASDSVEMSYLQIYMESVQDLLAPEKVNIPIVDDPKNGEVSVPGAAVVKIQNLDHFLHLLQIGEANRHAANTRMNTESSRSHAILMVSVRRSVIDKEENNTSFQGKDDTTVLVGGHVIPTVRKSKLLIVDLAGSERLDKSGSEGHLVEETKFINLSLSSLGKCINALAENSPHIPTRDSKLTRLLRDSFGGSARTSLIVTIGPSSKYHTETASTIMFGQRAMKVVNYVKLKEEFDYESLCHKLENQIDILTKEVDRQQKSKADNTLRLENNLKECQNSFEEAQKSLIARCEVLEKDKSQLESEMKDVLKELNFQKDQNEIVCKEVERLERSLKHCEKYEVETSTYQKVLADTTQMYEKKISELMSHLDDERERSNNIDQQLNSMKNLLSSHEKSMEQYEIERSTYQKALAETTQMYEKRIMELVTQVEDEHERYVGLEDDMISLKKASSDHHSSLQEIDTLRKELQEMSQLHEAALDELELVKTEYKSLSSEKDKLSNELYTVREALSLEEKRRKAVEKELSSIKNAVPESEDDFEDKRPSMKENIARGSTNGAPLGLHNSNKSRESNSFQRTTIAKICEEVGLQKILALLQSADLDVQTHAVKVVANLAAEDINQEKIVQEGGLDALLILLRTSQNTTLLRVASGAIANLAMNELNQGLIMGKGGAALLAHTSSKTDDPQTLRMVAGAIANLCGNEKLHLLLIEQGGVRALLGMVRSGNNDVIAQVARGLANFAKCETRAITQGHKEGRSLLMDDGVLSWLLANSNTSSISTRRHIELALCHLAQNEDNTRDFVTSGGVKQLARISVESSRDDIRNLAKKILRLNRAFQAEVQHG